MSNLKVDYKLNINYEDLLGKAWAEVLNPLLESPYMENLMVFLNESYKIKNVRPHKNNVFKSFSDVNFQKVRVVIIGGEPYNNMKSTGTPYANKDSFGNKLSPELLELFRGIEEDCYDGLNINLDPELKHFSRQGVMMLNCALTSEEGVENAHVKYWANFIRQFLLTMSEWKPGTIYMLWGKEAQSFSKYIDIKKNYVLGSDSLEEAVKSGKPWSNPKFSECNAILSMLNGSRGEIVW